MNIRRRSILGEPPQVDWSKKHLTFVTLSDGQYTFTNQTEYSKDDGETWTQLEANEPLDVVKGDKIMWRGTIIPNLDYGSGTFSSTAYFNAKGNPLSLNYEDEFDSAVLAGYNFKALFSGNKQIINAENLSLPTIELTDGCYSTMFSGCTSLVTAPELPAETLAVGCYSNMFTACSSLTVAPELPATGLANSCYSYRTYFYNNYLPT